MIHWGKYNVIGKLVNTIARYQSKCHASLAYEFPERRHIQELINGVPLMSEKVLQYRCLNVLS